ncbi:MAG: TIGR00730 family Rossman fold protein, partial [Anaerolineae bacterium]|nr:TIGR00730 family Rossman fold protein [Anaerolineae bacterium]
MNICVFCSSSSALVPSYYAVATAFGQSLARMGHTLVYGGADIGLMGRVARAVSEGGGYVIGVMPEMLASKRISYVAADKMIITHDMRERKAEMAARADAFVALPGGFGTLEELMEVLTLRQLQVHTKAIVLLNTRDFYTPLINVFEHFYR